MADSLNLFKKEREHTRNDQLPIEFGNDIQVIVNEVISSCNWIFTNPKIDLSQEIEQLSKPYGVIRNFSEKQTDAVDLGICYSGITEPFYELNNNKNSKTEPVISISDCRLGDIEAMARTVNCQLSNSALPIRLENCVAINLNPPGILVVFGDSQNPEIEKIVNCIVYDWLSAKIYKCFVENTEVSVPVPCEYVDIPVIEPPPVIKYPCGPPEPSDKLSLSLIAREDNYTDNGVLPIVFSCKYNTKEQIRRSTYMIKNTVTASIDGRNLGIYSATISIDMDSFCWQFSVEINPEDFAAINLESRNNPAIMVITVNGKRWDMLIEDYSDRKAFNRDSYTLSGRSKSSLLTADYAKRKTQIVDNGLFASQIAQNQLSNLPYSLTYEATDSDWYVPANTYTVSGTPIETISDIANAGGNYLTAHPHEDKLFIRKRWAAPAWQIANKTPDKIISAATWLEASGNRKVSTKYNSVRLNGTVGTIDGGHVFRQGADKQPEASTVTHSLYAKDANNTSRKGMEGKGIQVLSDSGKHKTYSLTMIWNDTDNINLANLGEVWQVNDVTGLLCKGIVQGLSISISNDNDATTIKQTVTIDHYLGD